MLASSSEESSVAKGCLLVHYSRTMESGSTINSMAKVSIPGKTGQSTRVDMNMELNLASGFTHTRMVIDVK